MQDVFGKIAAASATKNGNNLRDGKYRLRIERFVLNTGHNGTCFIPEFRVMEAQKTEPDVEPNQPGATVSCVWNVSKHSSAPGNVKGFLLAVFGLNEASVPPDKMRELTAAAVGADQPLRGMEIDCTTIRRVNQGKENPANRGMVMTLPTWQHVAGQTQESVTRARAELDGAATAAAAPAAPAAPTFPPPSAPAETPPAAGGFLAGILK
jgi:hypothetical protein